MNGEVMKETNGGWVGFIVVLLGYHEPLRNNLLTSLQYHGNGHGTVDCERAASPVHDLNHDLNHLSTMISTITL